AENNDIIVEKEKQLKAQGRVDNLAHCESRPPIAEIETIAKLIMFAKETGARLAFAHVSTPEAMELVKRAKSDGVELYLETCPHYMFLCEDDIIKFGPYAKCNPPVRDRERMNKIWDYINDGSVDYIGSDHGPFLLSEKEAGKNNIFDSPSGFPGLEVRVPLVLNAVTENKISLNKAIELLCTNPAKIFDIYPKKGVIEVGSDADIMIVDMKHKKRFSKDNSYCKSKEIGIVYDGWELKGFPKYTIVRGSIIMENGVVNLDYKGYGELVTPNNYGG
ncbi:MAG: dihydroorotase family protein, partial [Tissierellia bacterium]|nr:dihydroorotase family protein [Tissierellia bacterium]